MVKQPTLHHWQEMKVIFLPTSCFGTDCFKMRWRSIIRGEFSRLSFARANSCTWDPDYLDLCEDSALFQMGSFAQDQKHEASDRQCAAKDDTDETFERKSEKKGTSRSSETTYIHENMLASSISITACSFYGNAPDRSIGHEMMIPIACTQAQTRDTDHDYSSSSNYTYYK
jgi:hypothetical protein